MNNRTSSWHRTPLALAALVACAFPCHADEGSVATAPESASPMVVADGEMVAPKAPDHPAGNVVSARALQADGALPEPAAPRAVEVPPPPVPLRWTSSAQLVGGAYRLSLSRGPLDIGMSFDTSARTVRPVDPRVDTQGPVMSTLPAVSLGFRQGGSDPSTAGSLLERATSQDNGDYTSKVGIQWKPAESNVSFIREGLGFRLDGNERVTMKLRKGMLGLYMQHRF
jgi:hypothetical protein